MDNRRCDDANEQIVPMKCLEFFAGIGGFHYALREAGLLVNVRALDINNVTNAIYRYNFPNVQIQQCNIEKLTVNYYDDYNADIWTLSPPCQPFTKKGLRKDLEDHRCDALKSICSALGAMQHPPRFIVLENVRGFETSEAHDLLKNTLLNLRYYSEEYVVSPTEIGIPNSRPRYYLLAKLNHNLAVPSTSKISEFWPVDDVTKSRRKVIGEYLHDEANEDSALIIPCKRVRRFWNVMSFVTPYSSQSTCFTKSYYHYIVGTGPILLRFLNEDQVKMDQNMSVEELRNFLMKDNFKNLSQCQVRYFSWREMADLLGFPDAFLKPSDITVKQMYHALGNSISVTGVAFLIRHLITL